MRLYEYEAKALLQKHNVAVPKGVLLTGKKPVSAPCVVKAQLLFGRRADFGGIKICRDKKQADEAVKKLLGASLNGGEVKSVLVEELVDMQNQYYAGFLFDTDSRSPVLLFSVHGGTGIEEQEEVQKLIINELTGLSEDKAATFLKENKALAPLLSQLWNVFVREDCKLLEINPIAQTKSGFICLDAHIDLDDFALGRHRDRTYPERPASLGRPLTEREKAVKDANDLDYHGTVKYIELDGDIAFLAAGGGGSITCMDALIDAGGRPANYTEFSGDPSDEKMYILTKQAITKPGIRGCWIVGAIANFSRVDTMMAGIVRAFEEVKPKFPIVVRRAGPFEKEGLAILKDAAKKHGWNVEVYGAETPLTATAEVVVKKAYGNSSK
ncbi:MAG: ATP-grasp domain-containing protein [Candidatus Woesearchaeota archaeon]